MDIKLKLIPASLKTIAKMVFLLVLLVNGVAYLLLRFGFQESPLYLYPEEWLLLELFSILLGFTITLLLPKAEMICYHKEHSQSVRLHLERLLDLNSYRRIHHIDGVSTWTSSSLLRRWFTCGEGVIRIEWSDRMIKLRGPRNFVMRMRNKLVWSRDFAPRPRKEEEVLVEV